MTSSFTWLDYSEQERRRMLDVVDLFREQDTRDEMGIATLRDAFSDLLFPGTGSLQTRARYFLFTPWIYRALEGSEVSSAKIAGRARQVEGEVITALKEREGPAQGVIGAVAGTAIRRLPSNIYWFGLAKWGVLLFPGSQDSYHRSLDRYYERLAGRVKTDDGEALDRLGSRNWDLGIPPAPEGFPGTASFALTRAEGTYLQEQILRRVPGSLLAFMVAAETPSAPTGDFPWEDEGLQSLPEPIATHVRHARCFAEAMHGAGLLYNLMLSELSHRDELAHGYSERLAAWGAEVASRRSELEVWWAERDLLWRLAGTARGAAIPTPARIFIERWIGWLLGEAGVPLTASSGPARGLVRQREEMLKRGLSRFTSRRALEMWGGSSGAGRLDYRWGSVRRVVADIREGMKGRDSA